MANWAKTIQPKSDQLNADDLVGGSKIIKIREVRISDSPDQPASIFYEGDNGKPYKPCKTMRKLMAHCWGLDEAAFVGKRMELFRDDTVRWAGEEVGGIRIKAMSGIKERKRVVLQASKQKKVPVTVEPLPDEAPQAAAAPSTDERRAKAEDFSKSLQTAIWDCKSLDDVDAIRTKNEPALHRLNDAYPDIAEVVAKVFNDATNMLKGE